MHPQARRHVRPRPREHERMHTSARASTCMRMKSVLACIGTSHINHHARLVATCAPSLSLHPPSALSFGGSRSMVTRRGRRCERSRSRDSRLLTPVHTHTHTHIRGRARAREHMQACGPRQGGCCPGKTFRPTPGGMLPWQHFFFAWLRVGFLTTSGCLSVRGRAPQAPCRHQALFKLASLSCGRRFLRGLLLDIRWDSLSHGAHSYTATRLENYRAGGPRGYQ